MDWLFIGATLVQDGVATGAIYALLGMALVLVFAVTRVIFFPQGEFVTFAALSLAWLQAGKVPGTLWLMVVLAFMAGVAQVSQPLRERDWPSVVRCALLYLALPLAFAALVVWAAPRGLPLMVQCALALALVTALGPLIYRVVYHPIADAGVLALMIVSVGVHFVLAGLGLVFFGVEGFRTPAFWDGRIELGPLTLGGQAVVVVAVTLILIVILAVVFGRTLHGKALRAAASNAAGARLLAISVPFCGSLSFTVAAFIGGLCGLLIGPIVTIYYDTGLLIGLKGFVAAIVGGLVSYPLTLVGALGVGIVESFASFGASAFKEVIVFMLVVPVLLVLSARSGGHDEERA